MSLVINFLCMKVENTNKWKVKSLDSEARQTELNPSPATYQWPCVSILTSLNLRFHI